MSDDLPSAYKLLKIHLEQIDGISAYIFGSSTRLNAKSNDIDILIIYDDPKLPQKIRTHLKGMCYVPIHLLFLTEEEEIETNFIAKQNCIAIL